MPNYTLAVDAGSHTISSSDTLIVWSADVASIAVELNLFESDFQVSGGASISIVLPLQTVLMSVKSGATGSINAILGWPQLQDNNGKISASLYGAGSVNLALPVLSDAAFAMTVGNLLRIKAVLPTVETLIGSTIGSVGDIDIDLPLPTMTGVWPQVITGNIAGAIPLPRWNVRGYTGGIGSIDADLTLLEYSGTMLENGVGSVSVTLPVLLVDQYGTSTPSTISYQAVVLNMKNFSVSEYPSYGFNSMVTYQGQRLAAAGNKIYKVGAQNDSGEDITMTIGSGNLDLTKPVMMLPRDMWLTLRSGKTVNVRILENEKSDDFIYTYESEDFVEDLRSTRVKLGRGLKGQSLMFEVDNIDGEYLDIESIHILSSVMHRRKR